MEGRLCIPEQRHRVGSQKACGEHTVTHRQGALQGQDRVGAERRGKELVFRRLLTNQQAIDRRGRRGGRAG